MKKLVSLVAAIVFLPGATLAAGALDQWGQWRGPLGNGVAPHGRPPVEWNEGRNIRWKVAIRGQGHSTPIVWGDRIFLTTAIPSGEALPPRHEHAPGAHDNRPASSEYEFVVLALSRRDGKTLWERTVRTERPHESTHESGSWASASAVTDGEVLIASFGSRGVYGLDLSGHLLWQTDVGDMQILHGHGEGSSPALHGDTVVVNWDHQGESFVIALDKRTGQPRWKVARKEGTSWSSPLLVEHDGKVQVIVAATHRVRAYDLATGAVIWECAGLSGNVVASPVAGDGLVYVTNSYETRELMAIRLEGAQGDITGTDHVVWTRHRHTPYVPSPLLYGGKLYFLKHYQGYLTCVDAKTGDPLFGPQRLPGIQNVYASLVGAADRVYIVSRNGTTVVIKHGATYELLARNQLDDSFSASPAIVGGELYLRGEQYLYCIAQTPAD